MKLKVLGSGSSGNCYLLENDTECLIIEAGVSFLEVKKALDFNVKKIVGIICSHRHKDHCEFIKDYCKAGIRAIAPTDFWNENVMEWWFQYGERFDETRGMFKVGNFSIKPFQLVHDVPCYGFYITHPDTGSLVYITDTEYCKYRFKGINHILVESNYDMKFVNKDLPNYEHILQGHMSLQTTLDFISTNDNNDLKKVVLLHLSDKNADSGEFLKRTKEVTNKDVYVAKKGLQVDLSLIPDWMK